MLNPKARRFLLIQQQLRIVRRQAALAATPDYAGYNATRAARTWYKPHALALLLRRGMAMDPYNTAEQL